MQGSLRVTDNGSFNVYSKSQEYKFTPDGLVRKGGRRAVHPVDSQLSYKVPAVTLLAVSTLCSMPSDCETQLKSCLYTWMQALASLVYCLLDPRAAAADLREGCAHCQGAGPRRQQRGEQILCSLLQTALPAQQAMQCIQCMHTHAQAWLLRHSAACAGLQGVPGALRQLRRNQEDQLLRAGAHPAPRQPLSPALAAPFKDYHA